MENKGEIVIYRSPDGGSEIEVNLRNNTVWLTQAQISDIFKAERSVITKHIGNVFNSGELERKSVCANFAHTAADGKTYKTNFYNLDMIISIGYRVNSKRGTQFRVWANKVLKDYLVKGYALNQKRLTETKEKLNEVTENLKLLGRIAKQQQLSENENLAFINLVSDYAFALDLLDGYDRQSVKDVKTKSKTIYKIELDEALNALEDFKKETKASNLFGKPKDKSFDSSLNSIYQTYGRKELYPSLEDKAAHLLYFVVKNHSFVDGNKRIGAFLFIWFLNKNNFLLTEKGNRRISNQTLVALTIMIAESNPKEKELMIKLVKHLLNSVEN